MYYILWSIRYRCTHIKTTRSLYYVLWSILHPCAHTKNNSFIVLCTIINTISLYTYWNKLVHCIMYSDQYCIIVPTLKTTRSLYYVLWSLRYRCTHTKNNSFTVLCTMIITVSLYTHCKHLVHCSMYYDQYCIVVHTLKTTRYLYYVLWSIRYRCTHTEHNSFIVLCTMINTVSLYTHWKQLVHYIVYYDQYYTIVHILKTTCSLFYVLWSILHRCTHTKKNSFTVVCTMINTVSLYTHWKQLVHCFMYYD